MNRSVALPRHADRFLTVLVFGLALFGLVMIYSASVIVGHTLIGDDTYFVKKQLVSLLLGLVGMVSASQIDYTTWRRWSAVMLGATFLLLISVFIFSKGEINGAHRWIVFAGQSFQPSELAKLTLIIYLSGWLAERKSEVRSIIGTWLPFVIVLGLVSFLMLKQPDFGTLVIMVAAAVAIYFVAGMSWQQCVLGVLVLVMGGGAAIYGSEYRRERLMTFLNPTEDTQDSSYHVENIGIAVGSGGAWGVGFGESRQKRGFLPEPQTDSIFAVISEELGAVRSVLVIFAFLLLAYRGYWIALTAGDTFGKLMATGITSWFTAQAFMNLGAMLQLVPLVGVPLPFVSYGGTNLMISLTAAGILLSISKQRIVETPTRAERPARRRGR